MAFSRIYEKISVMARGITPGEEAVPCMENVLPVPVIP